jgi:linoleoyl-CoA desaturase
MNTSDSTNSALFVSTIQTRINDYFKENNCSIKSNWAMHLKIATGTLWWLLSYLVIVLLPLTKWEFFAVYLFHGMGHIFFSFNVGHDALHNAISKSKKINKFWSYSYDLLGVNTYMWRFMHHRGHHACLNIQGEDMSLETAGFFRLSSHEKRKKMHKYQHLYSFVIYGSYLFYYVFVKDYKYFFSKNNIHLKNKRHSRKEWVILFMGKFLYLSYMLFIPLYILPFSWSFIVFTFCVTLFMIGIIMSFTFQTTHIIDTTTYPKSKKEYENYVYHVFETTADYAANNPLANWFFGGLNVHVIHHLRSDICHIHYPALTRIVKATAKEFGVPYRENITIFDAGMAHLKQLKKLGTA